jgi:hypothetical protein
MGIPVISTIVPVSTGALPVVEDANIWGGYQVAASHTVRNAIPTANQKVGMLVYTVNDTSFWQLNSIGNGNGNWTLSPLGATGAAGPQGPTGPTGPAGPAASGGGSVSTGNTINGAQIIEANLGSGPYSTSAVLNAGATGMLLASRNDANNADMAVLQRYSSNVIQLGDLNQTNQIQVVAANTAYLQAASTSLYGGINQQVNATTNALALGANASTNISINGPATIATGSYLTLQGNGPVAGGGELRFSATGTIAAFRNAANNADLNMIKIDGNDTITIGNTTNGYIEMGPTVNSVFLQAPGVSNASIELFSDNINMGGNTLLFANAGFVPPNYSYPSLGAAAPAMQLIANSTAINQTLTASGTQFPLSGMFGATGPFSASGMVNFPYPPAGQTPLIAYRNSINTADVALVGGGGNNAYFGDITNSNNSYLLSSTQSILQSSSRSTIVGAGGAQLADFSVASGMVISATGTFVLPISVQSQQYGAQRVPTLFYSSQTGIGTAPSQFNLATNKGNFAFEGNIYVQPLVVGGTKISVRGPSGAFITMQAQGATGFDTFMMTGSTVGPYATAVGTGVYANSLGLEPIAFAGSVACAAGVTGPLTIGLIPVNNGATMGILPGSNIFLYPST